MMTGIGMGFGFLGWLGMFIFWGGLIALVIWGVRALTRSNQTTPPASRSGLQSPREILDQRYARGEITREQYELIKNDLAEGL